MTRELKGIAIIVAIYLIGEVISRAIGGVMPGSVLGMLLLFGLLEMGVVKEESIKDICNFVLSNMMLLFVPLTVGLMVSFKIIGNNWVGAICSIVISTIIVMVLVGLIQQYLGKRWRR